MGINRPYRTPRRRRWRGRRRFGVRETLAIALGAFAGTLGALQLAPAERAYAGADGVPIRVGASADHLRADFGFCHSGGGMNCVVDGDTFWFAGEKYRIADIDTPETHPARCAEEERLGRAATVRLNQWLNAGEFSLEQADRDTDVHGRKLRIVTRGGASVGTALVSDGLARPWEGRRRPWC